MNINLNLDHADIILLEVVLRYAIKDMANDCEKSYPDGIPGAVYPLLLNHIEGNADIHHKLCEEVNASMDNKSNVFGPEEAEVTELIKQFQSMKKGSKA